MRKGLNILFLESLEFRRKTSSLSFIKRSLADGKLRDLFPVRQKEHQIRTRNEEKYKTIHAHTQRYKNSTIITLHRLLNEDC